MATLDRWRFFLSTPQTLAFPELRLIGRDFEPPIVTGTGEVRAPSPSEFTFTLRGKPEDARYASAAFHWQQANPYDALARFRLVGVDSQGVEWSLGWTVPARIEKGESQWVLTGRLDQLSPHDIGDSVSKESTTEVIYLVPPEHPAAYIAKQLMLASRGNDDPLYEHVMEALGSKICFIYEPSSSALSITASHSSDLPPTRTEGWLGEPLRILFGQLISPRLIARNLGDGTSIMFVLPCHHRVIPAGWAALWMDEDASATDKAQFWARYTQLLTLVAKSDDLERRGFQPHKVTRLYDEVIQAALGSRWVWALTLASSIEGLAKMLIPKGATPPQAEMDAIGKLVAHINVFPDEARLKQIACSAVHRTAETTTIRTLRELTAANAVTVEQVKAWDKIRNSVMHGSLVSPYSSEEEDAQLLALAALMRALTREILRRFVILPTT
jgi:hypothetical protein